MDAIKSSAPAHPNEGIDDAIEAHYAGVERLRPHGCYEGLVYIGHLEVDPETGDEVEVTETVPCRRCARDFDVLPVEEEETITGYVERSSLDDGHCADYKRSFFPSDLVTDSTPLRALFEVLWDSPRVFVLENNSITGIITRADLQKAPVRIMLFGLVTLLEIQVLQLIRDCYPNDSWQGLLTPGRLDEAKNLYTQRLARNEEIDLADCLQLCDKRTLVLKRLV